MIFSVSSKLPCTKDSTRKIHPSLVLVKNVYAVYRFSPSAIGFAALANTAALLQGYIPIGNGTDIAHGANSTCK